MSVNTLNKNFTLSQLKFAHYDFVTRYAITNVTFLPKLCRFETQIISKSEKNISHEIINRIKEYFFLYSVFSNSPKVCINFSKSAKKSLFLLENFFLMFFIVKQKSFFEILFAILNDISQPVLFNSAISAVNMKTTEISTLVPITDIGAASSLSFTDQKDLFLKINISLTDTTFINSYTILPIFQKYSLKT